MSTLQYVLTRAGPDGRENKDLHLMQSMWTVIIGVMTLTTHLQDITATDVGVMTLKTHLQRHYSN